MNPYLLAAAAMCFLAAATIWFWPSIKTWWSSNSKPTRLDPVGADGSFYLSTTHSKPFEGPAIRRPSLRMDMPALEMRARPANGASGHAVKVAPTVEEFDWSTVEHLRHPGRRAARIDHPQRTGRSPMADTELAADVDGWNARVARLAELRKPVVHEVVPMRTLADVPSSHTLMMPTERGVVEDAIVVEVDDEPVPDVDIFDHNGTGADESWAIVLHNLPAGRITPAGVPEVNRDDMDEREIRRAAPAGHPVWDRADFSDEEIEAAHEAYERQVVALMFASLDAELDTWRHETTERMVWETASQWNKWYGPGTHANRKDAGDRAAWHVRRVIREAEQNAMRDDARVEELAEETLTKMLVAV